MCNIQRHRLFCVLESVNCARNSFFRTDKLSKANVSRQILVKLLYYLVMGRMKSNSFCLQNFSGFHETYCTEMLILKDSRNCKVRVFNVNVSQRRGVVSWVCPHLFPQTVFMIQAKTSRNLNVGFLKLKSKQVSIKNWTWFWGKKFILSKRKLICWTLKQIHFWIQSVLFSPQLHGIFFIH